MARPCPTITLRRKRILRDAGLLLLSLAVLLVLFSFPYLTREQALWALKKQYFFDGSRVVAWAEDPDPRSDDQYVILRSGNWYALGSLERDGLFWETGWFRSAQKAPDLPLTPVPPRGGAEPRPFLCVLSSNPEIAEVELEYLASDPLTVIVQRRTVRREAAAEDCFLLPMEEDFVWMHGALDSFRLRGYDQAGNLIYESPEPESWAEYWISPSEEGVS